MKVIIVGGVAGGMSAATRLRRLNEDAEITVYEKGDYASFANCGLPYHISGEIADRDDLIVQSAESLKSRFNINTQVRSEVIAIDPDQKQVTVERDGQSFQDSYDKLILSPGADPIVPGIKGLDQAENVFTLRNIMDMDQIIEASKKAKKAVVVGGGFIGIEVAENLRMIGLDVSLVEMANHILPPLDEEMAIYVQDEMLAQGIDVLTNTAAVEIKDKGKKLCLDNGNELATDLIIMSVGVAPSSKLAQNAGIEVGMRGGILVDDQYRTNIEDIYAVGDAIVVRQQISNQEALISLASPANRQGRQVADIISGLERKNKGAIGTAIVRAFDITAASTGLNEKQVEDAGLTYRCVHISGKNHAGYFPNAKPIMLKLIFNPDNGTIYGAQGVGQDGVDKRIDILSTAIKAGMTIYDLPELEFTYAPPFGSAKDPVNMLGYAAMNITEGLSDNIQWHELQDYRDQGYAFLDVRSKKEVSTGRFPSAQHIPVDELRDRLDELDPEQKYVVSCHSGLRSYIAERILKQKGFEVVNLDGAYSLYSKVRPEEIE